ncbi:MAG: LysR family transcriptional regulator [Burkholderiales bacterium]|nr:LysR family transcriptional regulator [Burkholderiales bacterium]
MRLKDLRYLVLVGRTLCFREAARRCGVRSSTLIEQVNRVEQRLGARVFERSRNGLFVTPAGREILRLALGMTAIEEHLMRAAASVAPARPQRGLLAAAVAIRP